MAGFVTGVQQLDRAMDRFSEKVQKKFIRDAAKGSAKQVLEQYKAEVPVDTGAMRDAAKTRALKRSRVRIGYTVIIDRKKLFALRTSRMAKASKNQAVERLKAAGVKAKDARRLAQSHATAAKTDDKNFYPAFVEFGTPKQAAKKPMRHALYRNKEFVIQQFQDNLQRAIDSATP